MVDLETLFKEWKIAHEEDKNWENNFPKDSENTPPEEFKGNFIKDGKFSDCADEVKILFIARESNISEDIKNENYPVFGEFWIKQVVETMQKNEKNDPRNYYGSNLKPRDKRAQTSYYNYLGKICEYKNTTLLNCAYMNLNKRGGYGRCCFTRLEKYIDNYKDYIQEEIRLLNPEIVVFLGWREGYGKKVFELIKGVNPDMKCYEVYHPSAPGKNKSLDKLKKGITL